MMLETQKLQLQSTVSDQHLFQAMKNAQQQQEILQKQSGIDQFEDIREKFEEQQDKQAEINDFFTQFAEENGEDVQDELEALEAEMAEEEFEDVKPIPGGKIKPKTQEEVAKKEEEDLLAELNN